MGVQILQKIFWNPKCGVRMSSDSRPDGCRAVVGRLSDGRQTAVGRPLDDRWTAVGRPSDGGRTIHRTLEKSDFRCSCNFFEGSPHVTVPLRSLVFDYIFFGISSGTRDSPARCVFLASFGQHFGIFATLKKTSMPPRACKFWLTFV